MSESVRIVKKYQNRKLYDTQDSCYVTLDGIAKMIRRGEEIVVIDNNSKEDVTALILTQVLYEQEKTNQSVLPVPILKNIIKSGSNNLYEFMQKYILGALDAAIRAQKEMTSHVDRLVKAGDLTSNEGDTLINQLNEAVDGHKGELDQTIETKLEAKFNQTPQLQTEFQMMSTRLASLENRP
jgi:polyhydroxyalkanoate synthesis repressor PhaR